MERDTQDNYSHEIPQEINVTGPRINVTFRRTDDISLQKEKRVISKAPKGIVGKVEKRGPWGDLEFKTDSEWAIRQWELGQSYAEIMAGFWYELMSYNNVDAKPNFMESNQRALEFGNKMNKKFRSLSKVSQLAATYEFLNANLSTMKSRHVTAPRRLPPSTDKAFENKLLDDNILRSFIEYYNNEIDKNRNANTKFENVVDLDYEEFIEQNCG